MTNLMAIFKNHYQFFAQQPELSRLLLREMLFYDSGRQANRFRTTREKVISLVCKAVHLARKDRSIKSAENDRAIAWVLFCVYQGQLRRWLAEDVDLKNGLEHLRKALELTVSGIKPTSWALEFSPRKRAQISNGRSSKQVQLSRQ